MRASLTVAVIVLALAGCSTAPNPAPNVSTESRNLAAPAESNAPPTAKVEELEGYDDCADRQLVLDESDPNQVAQVRVQIPVDSGPQPYARGEAVLDGSGTPVAYIVAADDIGEFIAERFCLSTDYLHSINAVRRDAALNLYVGDTLNLDATTILSVGDQNGQVLDHTPPSPIPPQR